MKNFKTLYKEYANLNPAFAVGGSSTGSGLATHHPTADLNLRATKKKKRNYRKEYDNYQSKPEQIEKRSSRNKAARFMGVKKGMDVHHKDNNPLNNDPKNLEHLDISTNRREPRLREVDKKMRSFALNKDKVQVFRLTNLLKKEKRGSSKYKELIKQLNVHRKNLGLEPLHEKYKADVHYQYMTYQQGRRKHYVASGEGDTKKQAIDKAMKIYKSDRNVKRGHNVEVDKVVTKKI